MLVNMAIEPTKGRSRRRELLVSTETEPTKGRRMPREVPVSLEIERTRGRRKPRGLPPKLDKLPKTRQMRDKNRLAMFSRVQPTL